MSAEIKKYDAIIVGGGKAGKTLAMDLAKSGSKVAMIENGLIGGTCINVACIPTKTLVRSAELAHLMRRAQEFGIEVSPIKVDLKAIKNRKNKVVNGMRDANLKMFLASGMDFILGKAHFIGPKKIEVALTEPRDGSNTLTLTADKIFINTGALPFIPDIPGLKEVPFHTNETMMELETVPEKLLIIGGGYIGLEFGQMFRRFGSEVTIVELSKDFLPAEDRDIAQEIQTLLEAEGIQFRLGYQIDKVSAHHQQITLEIHRDADKQTLTGTHLFLSVGRIPNTKDLNLEATDVKVDQRGFIIVNEYLETNVPGIWALGDVKGGPQFTHISLDDYRILKTNLTANKPVQSIKNRLLPYTVFIDPEFARIGLTEKQAREQGYAIKVVKMPVADIPRAKTLGETKGVIKAIINTDTDQILGAAVLCAAGGEVMATIELAIRTGMKYQDLKNGIFAHPTLVEGFNQLFSLV